MKKAFFYIFIINLSIGTNFLSTEAANVIFEQHSGRSPISFDVIAKPSDTVLVSDRGIDNDIYRLRDDSKQYDFVFPIKISRYVGNYADITNLLANNLISKEAVIHIPTYDVDTASSTAYWDCDNDGIADPYNPEVNNVYLNDKFIGTLKGLNNQWVSNSFNVDIRDLNFPLNPGEDKLNYIQVKQDAANINNTTNSTGAIGCKRWSAEIDYVLVEFDVVDPVYIQAGLFGDPTSLIDSSYVENLKNYGIPAKIYSRAEDENGDDPDNFNYFGCNSDTKSFHIDGGRLRDRIVEDNLNSLRSNKVNIIGYSKGGLDSRFAIQDLYTNIKYIKTSEMNVDTLGVGSTVLNQLEVNSFTSHGSPYGGTEILNPLLNDYLLGGGVGGLTEFFLKPIVSETDKFQKLAAIAGDVCDLSPDNATNFTQSFNMPTDINYLVINGDADKNDDLQLTIDEAMPYGLDTAKIQYNILSNTRGLFEEDIETVCSTPVGVVQCTKTKLTFLKATTPLENDIMVTIKSAIPHDSDKDIKVDANHNTIIHMPNQNIVIDEGLNGMLEWR